MRPGCKQRSVVWDHFKKHINNKTVTCQICKKDYKYYGNTTNLKEHLKRIHPTKLNPITHNEDDPDNQLIQTTENTFSPSTSAISSNLSSEHLISSQFSEPPSKRPRQLKLFGSTKVNELSDSEIKAIDKSLIKMIVADYQPLSLVENVGFIEYTKKLQPLYSIPSRKVLTSKLLPQEYNAILLKIKSILLNVNDLSITTDMWTSDSNKSYITMTCHFIFDDQLYSPIIATKEVSDRHTGQNIAATLTNIFNDWNIANKIITVVSDNGTIVGHFKHSSNATEKLKDFQLQMNLPPLKVKQDVPTRWNSSFIMMERLVNIKAPLSATMSTLPRAPNYLNASEWEIILDCTHILKPFQIMTAELSETDVGDVFRNMLIDIVSRRLGILEKNKIVAKATFLDPRFKKTAFGLLENASNAQKWVSEELTMMISTNTEMENEINTTESTTALTLNSTNNTTESLWEHFNNKVAQVKTTSSPNITSTLIIRQYLEMTLLDRKKTHWNFGNSIKTHFLICIICS
ncbi:hypothetical protein QTP88_004363 [Uroleucon formosanum]